MRKDREPRTAYEMGVAHLQGEIRLRRTIVDQLIDSPPTILAKFHQVEAMEGLENVELRLKQLYRRRKAGLIR